MTNTDERNTSLFKRKQWNTTMNGEAAWMCMRWITCWICPSCATLTSFSVETGCLIDLTVLSWLACWLCGSHACQCLESPPEPLKWLVMISQNDDPFSCILHVWILGYSSWVNDHHCALSCEAVGGAANPCDDGGTGGSNPLHSLRCLFIC